MRNNFDLNHIEEFNFYGEITSATGNIIRAKLPNPKIDEVVEIYEDSKTKLGKITAFNENEVILTMFDGISNLHPSQKIKKYSRNLQKRLKANQIGNVIDAMANNISHNIAKHPIRLNTTVTQHGPRDILNRLPVNNQFRVGINSIDSFLTLGHGQRIVMLAEPGVGKSTLLLSIAENCDADLVIFALIGERGREVTELYDELQISNAINKSIVVASSSDQSALMRAEAADTAFCLAEQAAAQGLNVLIAFDSLTRYLRSLRDIGLSRGEMPVRRGYPVSSYEQIPKLIERAGKFKSGSITAIFTMLSSADLDEDPMVEEVKGLTDGHIILSKKLADSGYFPAIDIRKSISRLHNRFWNAEQLKKLADIKREYCELEDNQDLLLVSQNLEAYNTSKNRLRLISDYLYSDINNLNCKLEDKINLLHQALFYNQSS